MPDWEQISDQLQVATGMSLRVMSARSVGGGCISSAFVLESAQDSRSFFVKINRAENLAMFEAEREGLLELAKSNSLRVPTALHCGVCDDEAYLVMEYVPLKGVGDDELLGKGLAAMHRAESQVSAFPPKSGQGQFGWHRDNTIGSTPQVNDWAIDWVHFWAEQRLGYQIQLAAKNGAGQIFVRRAEKLQAALPVFLPTIGPQPLCCTVICGRGITPLMTAVDR